MHLGLKIDVDTYRGTREGVPALLRLLDLHKVRATFLFSLGPDRTGRAIKRIFRPGFFSKVSRTSVIEHYGYKTLMYGVLLPSPDIGKRCAQQMRDVRAAGHEVGIHTWDHVIWQDGVERATDVWTERQMLKAHDRFAEVFGAPSTTHGAAGWQMNDRALQLTAELGYRYCSDGRGTTPFLPLVGDQIVNCPQLPTTLPTLDELIGIDGLTATTVAEHVLNLTNAPRMHVYTLHAELEGMRLLTTFDALLRGWKRQGYMLGPTRDLLEQVDIAALPVHRIARGEIPGRTGTLLLQGERVS